jgi:hypothetical protein
MKFSLLLGGGRLLDNALSYTLKFETLNAAARPPARTEYSRTERPICCQCRGVGHLKRDCRWGYSKMTSSKKIHQDQRNKNMKKALQLTLHTFELNISSSSAQY